MSDGTRARGRRDHNLGHAGKVRVCELVPQFDRVLGMLAYFRVAPRLLPARQPLAPA